MKRLILLTALISATLSACTIVRTKPDDWIVLFDGTSTDAWRGYRSEMLPEGWKIQGDALVRVEGGGDIITKEQFESFDFHFEWRVSPGGNSGVIWHVTEDHGATYETGPEYQILDNGVHRDGGDPRTSAAANYALHAPPADYTKPPGSWNVGRLEVDGPRVRHWLNGKLVVDYERWTDEWKEMVKASKFDAMPDYGLNKSGHIALQDHGDVVSYRNMRVRRLD